MKIIFLSALYPPTTKGGGEISTHYIAHGLVKRGHDVKVFTGGQSVRQYVINGVQVVQLPIPLAGKPLLERQASKQMARKIQEALGKEVPYDIIHAHDFRSILALSELDLKNTVITSRDYAQISGCTNNMLHNGNINPGCAGGREMFLCHRIVEAPWWRKPFRAWQYWYNVGYRSRAFQKFQYQIFISQAQKNEIARYQNLEKATSKVIYNPVSQEYLDKPLVPGNKNKVLYVGRVEKYKGVGLLLNSWQQVIKKNPQAHLTIVGEGAQNLEYKSFVKESKLEACVTFRGSVPWDKLISLYDQASIVVAPHLWVEPFGRTVVEGMARGKIVITANSGGPSEVVQNNMTGFLFNVGSTTDLTEKLNRALALPDQDRQSIGLAGHEWTKKHLNIDLIAQQHEEFYKLIK